MIDFTIKGLDETLKNLEGLKDRVETASTEFLTAVVQHVTERAIQNAPIKTGALRNNLLGYVEDTLVFSESSGKVKAPKVNSNIIKGQVIDLMEYAVKMHEGLYGLGPISRVQGSAPEGAGVQQPVGRKYISRVVDFHLNSYINGFKSAMLSAIQNKGLIDVSFNKT